VRSHKIFNFLIRNCGVRAPKPSAVWVSSPSPACVRLRKRAAVDKWDKTTGRMIACTRLSIIHGEYGNVMTIPMANSRMVGWLRGSSEKNGDRRK
jgi:hypothetical protein